MLKDVFEFIVNNKIVLLIPLLFASLLLILDTFANANKVSWVGFGVFLLSLGGFIYISIKPMELFKIDGIIYVFGLSVIAFIYNGLSYARASFKYNKLANLLIALPSNIESQIYLFLDERSRLLLFTDQFYEMFVHLNFSKKGWKKQLKNVVVEDKEYSYKKFARKFRHFEEKAYKMKFIFKNEAEVSIQLAKQKVINQGKLLGYVLLNQKLSMTEVYKENVKNEFRKRQDVFFDLLGKPLAYFDYTKNRLVLNSLMGKLLQIEEKEINISEFEEYIFEEDKKTFNHKEANANRVFKKHYRLKTINGVEWFEESSLEFEDNKHLIIHRSDFSTLKTEMYNYDYLIRDIKSLGGRSFVLVIIAINDIPHIIERIGPNGCEIVISQYFQEMNTYAKETEKVYKVGQVEYALIVQDMEKYDVMNRDLDRNHSAYLGAEIYFNEMKFVLNNVVGVVSSNVVEDKTAESIVKAGLNTLNLANKSGYMKPYSIYHSQRFAGDPSDFDIDLSDDFLEKMLKNID